MVDIATKEYITDRGWIWDSKKRGYELNPQEKFELTIDQIPRLERNKIESAIKMRKGDVTDAEVMRLYRTKLESLVNKRGK
jgi:hypothetical protein